MKQPTPDRVKEIAKLADPLHFERRFWQLVPDHPTYEAAYEHLEKEFESIFKHRKYSSYDSFRVCRSRRRGKHVH